MEERMNRKEKQNRNSILQKIDHQIFWAIEQGNKDQSTRDSLRMYAFYAYYNHEILEEIMDCVYSKFGEFDDYLEYIKRKCEALKEQNSYIVKTNEYLYFEKIINENLGQTIEDNPKRTLNKNSSIQEC